MTRATGVAVLEPPGGAVLIASAHYRNHHYGPNHPLSIPRVSLTLDLIRAYHAIEPHEFIEGRPASVEELCRFHARDYIAALARAEASGHATEEDRHRHHFGTVENPWFPGLFYTPALATGSSIMGADAVLGGRRAFSPAGGMHHALPDRARGFCYLNDAVLAILQLKEAGLRVLYLDLDAHHGDGVEQAFANDPDVFTLSLHMDTTYAYPFSGGTVADQGAPAGGAACLNVPLPAATNDREYRLLFDAVWPRVLHQFRPDAVVVQAGTDALFGDPLGRFNLSTNEFLRMIAQVVADASRLLVIGGGGYHPLLLARCWAGVWGLLSGRALPIEIPPEGTQVLQGAGWDQDDDVPAFERYFTCRLDEPTTHEIRPALFELVDRLYRVHPVLRGS
ncbi:MAG: acetoin utilization protein AcuC [Acidiferrobacteraceae bacterium]